MMDKNTKYILVNINDGNNRIELEAQTINTAYREALEILGWHIVKQGIKMRIRTIDWCMGKIIDVLSKRSITTELAMSAIVLKNVQSLDEQHNYDIALANLLSKKQIKKEKDSDGFTVYKLVA